VNVCVRRGYPKYAIVDVHTTFKTTALLLASGEDYFRKTGFDTTTDNENKMNFLFFHGTRAQWGCGQVAAMTVVGYAFDCARGVRTSGVEWRARPR